MNPTFPRPGQYDAGMLGYHHTVGKLKTNKRTGWVNQGTVEAESIADHMYRMSMMALVIEDPNLDIPKCVMLSLVHDLAEADVGDITPPEISGISREDKLARESAAMKRIVGLVGSDKIGGHRLMSLWNEYEERTTPEAIFVKDLDMYELGVQGVEYERSQGIENLQSFFETTIPKIKHPQVKSWATELMSERRDLWSERGWSNYIHIEVASDTLCSIPVKVYGA